MSIKIDITQLRKADVIISTTETTVSKSIRKGTGSDFSHAILYIGNSEVLEAIGKGVTKRRWDQSVHDPEGEMTLAIALRRKGMDDVARQAVVDAALKYENLPYDITGAIGSGMFGNKRGGVIGSIGCSIDGKATWQTPRAVRLSSYLMYIGHLIGG